MSSKQGIGYVRFRIAETLFQLREHDRALEELRDAVGLVEESGNRILKSYCLLLYSNIYEGMEDFREALSYFKLYESLKEEIFNEDSNSKIAEMKAQDETYKKEKEAEIYRLKNLELVEMNTKLKKAYRELKHLAKTDFLTKTYNRREALEFSRKHISKGSGRRPFSVILIDMDDFKRINDVYGHSAGDYVLAQSAARIKACLRKTDIIARWGGEEFLIMLPDTTLENGMVVGEKIKNIINSKPFEFDDKIFNITITLGVSQYRHGNGIDETINRADLALYRGKKSGKNCVVGE
jgi:diguanylate cyclase (GGDEF)-like protein